MYNNFTFYISIIMFLCFDTETDTLPTKLPNGKPDFSKINLQQISYIIFSAIDLTHIIESYSTYVNYFDNNIQQQTFKMNEVTQITLQQLLNGKNIHNVLDDLYKDIQKINIIIAHNAMFDISVIKSLCIRYKRMDLFNEINKKFVFDTMIISGTTGLNIINKYYIKLEHLYELISKLNNDQTITDTTTKHEAYDDTLHCYYCFLFLVKHLGCHKIKYNNEYTLFKNLFTNKQFIKSCLQNKCQYSIKKRFIMYCMLKTGIYNNTFINYID